MEKINPQEFIAEACPNTQVDIEEIVHVVEVTKSEADAAAERAGIAEAESAFVPDAGMKEVEMKTAIAKKEANRALIAEEVVTTIIQAVVCEEEDPSNPSKQQ
jgi:aromatic ring hydroxylase